MHETFKYYAFVFLALRALIDLTLAVIICYQVGSLVPGIGLMLICCVFYFFLFFGIRNEKFSGRYGSRVFLWREPIAYWFIVALLVILHLIITVLIAMSVYWQANGR